MSVRSPHVAAPSHPHLHRPPRPLSYLSAPSSRSLDLPASTASLSSSSERSPPTTKVVCRHRSAGLSPSPGRD